MLTHLVDHRRRRRSSIGSATAGSPIWRDSCQRSSTGGRGLAPPARGDVDADRWSLFNAVHALVVGPPPTRPLVLVLDDLQWADRADPGPAAARRRRCDRRDGLLVVGTYRDGELGADHPLTDTLAALRRGCRRRTARAPRAGRRRTGRAWSSRSPGRRCPPTARRLRARRAPRDRREPVLRRPNFCGTSPRRARLYLDDAGRWVPRADLDTVGLPESVREVIRSRVRKLGVEAESICSGWRPSSARSSTSTLVGGQPARMRRRRSITSSGPRRPGSSSPSRRAGSRSPTRSSPTLCTPSSRRPGGPSSTAGSPRRSRTSPARLRTAGPPSWPVTGRRPPPADGDKAVALRPHGRRPRDAGARP